MNEGFRFSYDRYFGKFGLEDFRDTAIELKSVGDKSKSHLGSLVLTCEDENTYNLSKVSFAMDEVDKALKKRKEYPLEKIDEKVWNKSLRLQFSLQVSDTQDPLMICLTHDKAEEHRLFFYGQGLDEETYNAIIGKFHKSGLIYRLSDKPGKPSRLMNEIVDSGLHLNH